MTLLVDSHPYLCHFWGGCCRAWPTWSIIISSRSSAIIETSKPLKSSATAHAWITKSLFQHFKSFTSRFTQSHTELDAHLCSSTSAIPPLSENLRRLMQYTHKDTCNNQMLPHPTTPLGTLTHKTPPQHTLTWNSWTTSDLRVMSIVLGLLDTPLYFHKPVTCKSVSVTQRTGPKHVDALGTLIIWHHFKPTFFTIFRPRRGHAQNADNFRRNSFACGC